MTKPAVKKTTKPTAPPRPSINHGGTLVNLPLLTGPVGNAAANASGTYKIFNARTDVEVIEYYLGQLAKIKFLAVTCSVLDKPGPTVVQAADAVQCWDTNLDAAIRAFQAAVPVPLARMTAKERTAYDEEKKAGIILPDGPTLTALVDFGDAAEKLEAIKNDPKAPADYMYGGSFSLTKFLAAFDAEFGTDYRFDETPVLTGGANVVAVKQAYASANRQNLTTVVQKMAADSRLLDIRWMAYILATVLHETSLSKRTTVAVLDSKGNAVLDKKKNPVMSTFNATSTLSPVEEGGHGKGRNYYLAVKVKANADGTASVIEPDGNSFSVDATGKASNAANIGALPTFVGKAADAAFVADKGTEHAYYGRGYVQLTWWNNYASAGASIGRGLDLLYNPDLALDPTIAYEVMVHGMLTGDGFANGRRISRYIFGATKNYVGARAMVNGSDRAADIAAYAERFETVLMQAKTTP